MPLLTFHALGLMSGSSLDGLDLAYCQFQLRKGPQQAEMADWKLLQAETLPFHPDWEQKLRQLPESSARELALCHARFGAYLGELVEDFLARYSIEPDFIASHGHTIFHEPAQGMSLQIGDGAAIAARTGLPTIDNFRMQDVALGGQGAPLAPIADKLLFPDYDFLLNLGGICNMSCKAGSHYIAFDSVGANQLLNALAGEKGLPYDEGGQLAAEGKLDKALLRKAEQDAYFRLPYPKSLSNDWVREHMVAPYLAAAGKVEDKLHTACRQIARQIARDMEQVIRRERLPARKYRMLATGGGAFNHFLVACIREECEKICSFALEIPGAEATSFKEAALMALMGALRVADIPNCLPSVTNASRAAVGGAIHQGWKKQL